MIKAPHNSYACIREIHRTVQSQESSCFEICTMSVQEFDACRLFLFFFIMGNKQWKISCKILKIPYFSLERVLNACCFDCKSRITRIRKRFFFREVIAVSGEISYSFLFVVLFYLIWGPCGLAPGFAVRNQSWYALGGIIEDTAEQIQVSHKQGKVNSLSTLLPLCPPFCCF